MGRAPCCDKANVKKGPWSPEEDDKLKSYIEQNGTGGNWIALPQKIGLKRCGKSCRLRWLNYLRPNLRHGGFSEEEDNIICSLYRTIGSRWSIIAGQLPGRTDNDIKNYWNTRLKKKLFGKQRKPPLRQAVCTKQEVKRGDNGSGDGDGEGILSTYWPAASLPVYPVEDNERTSIKKLINNIAASHSIPFDIPELQQTFYVDTANDLMAPPPPMHAASIEESLQVVSTGFLMELDEIFNSNPVKLEGLDYFYGIDNMIDDCNGISTTDQSANWSEVSPLIYPPMLNPRYQGMQQCMFEEPVHLGMQ